MPARARHPRLGYALAATAAAMWALNGSLARFLLDDGVSAPHLSELRSAVSFAILLGVLALVRPALLRVRPRDLPRFAAFGILGLAGVHATYFFAISRLEIGVALVIQYLAPVLLLLWLRVRYGRRLPPALYAAVTVSVVGCALVVEAYDASSLDGLGVAAAFAAAVTFVVYVIASERFGHTYAPVTTLVYGFGFAALFWLLVRPPQTLPFELLSSPRNALLTLGVAVVGTLVPFVCIVEALRHIPGPRAAIVATLEPVLAALFAWLIHGEALSVPQLVGGAVVLCAVVFVQTRATDVAAEALPAYGVATPWRRAKAGGILSDTRGDPAHRQGQTAREGGTQSDRDSALT